jgi:tripartite ATP-independent transporter DctM subunit
MTPPLIGLTGILILFVLLIMRVPVWISLLLVGFFGNATLLGWQGAFALAGTTPFDVASNYSLSVLPLFIVMGEVASESRLSGELFNAARVLVSGFRGGLAVATLAASALFGAVSGSSLANAATMTRMALPELRKAGYDDGLATGCIAAGGSTDILIPPSIILVIYAAVAELSVAKLLAAGLIPGLLLTGLYMLVALAVAYARPDYAPDKEHHTWRERFFAMKEPWQFIALFVVTIGGIYTGVFSPTEAASIGAFGAILLGILGRRMGSRDLLRAIEGSVVVSGALFVIVIGANLLSSFIVQAHLPELLLDGARAMNLSGLAVMLLIIIGYIILGCFLEAIGMILITVPVFQPLIKSFGYDPIWFSIIVVIMVEVGLIHPPVGMNLFVIQAQAPEVKITSIYRGIVPFLIAPFVLILLMFLFPGIALWLPKALYG